MAKTPEEKKKLLDIRLNEHTGAQLNVWMNQMPEEQPAGSVLASDAVDNQIEQVSLSAVMSSEKKPVEQPTVQQPAFPQQEDEQPEEQLPLLRRLGNRILRWLDSVIPKRGDSVGEIVRKCVFFVALITLIGSVAYIINDMVIIPVNSELLYNQLETLYDPAHPAEPPVDFPEGQYPAGIADAFKALYAQNQDIRGWIKYSDTEGKWLDISYPVMYSGDNDYYLTHDFQKAKNKNGSIFFDERINLDSADAQNKVLVAYGHNMASGQMFSALNKFLTNRYNARSAPLIKLDTLFEQRQYQVFAVIMVDASPDNGSYFDTLRTSFGSDQDFMDYVANLRARSLYDYPTDVRPSDELLVLSTCTAESMAHFDDGRCVVVARRVRSGETVAVDTAKIVENDDVIMPYAWYTGQKDKKLHAFYTDPSYVIPGLWSSNDSTPQNNNSSTTWTPPSGTTASGASTTTRATRPGETTTRGPSVTTQGQGGDPTGATQEPTAAPTDQPPTEPAPTEATAPETQPPQQETQPTQEETQPTQAEEPTTPEQAETQAETPPTEAPVEETLV